MKLFGYEEISDSQIADNIIFSLKELLNFVKLSFGLKKVGHLDIFYFFIHAYSKDSSKNSLEHIDKVFNYCLISRGFP